MKCHPLFSPEDKDLYRYKWQINRGGYAKRSGPVKSNRRTQRVVFAHRVILQRILGRELTPKDITDHINGVKMDMRRQNIRLVDRYGNAQNVHLSPYRGTSLDKKTGKWIAAVQHNSKSYCLGSFTDRAEAARVAAAKRQELGFLNSHTVNQSTICGQ